MDGEYKVAQYGQWDGYPSGNGLIVLEFLKNRLKSKRANALFRKNLKAASLLSTEAELEALDKEIKAKGITQWWQVYPHLSRDMGAKILEYVLDQPPGLKLKGEIAFAADSLFCEWAYVVDLNEGNLEVYKGWQKAPHEEGRFCDFPRTDNVHKDYYPIRLMMTYPLDDLPSKREFLADLDDSED